MMVEFWWLRKEPRGSTSGLPSVYSRNSAEFDVKRAIRAENNTSRRSTGSGLAEKRQLHIQQCRVLSHASRAQYVFLCVCVCFYVMEKFTLISQSSQNVPVNTIPRYRVEEPTEIR